MRDIRVECRVTGYTLADCFHPNPKWGRKYLKASLPEDTPDASVIESSKKAAPSGYETWVVEDWSEAEKKTLFRRDIGAASGEGKAP